MRPLAVVVPVLLSCASPSLRPLPSPSPTDAAGAMHTVQLESFVVVGISRRVSNDRPDSIGALWAAFEERGGIGSMPNCKTDEVIALYIDYEGDHTKPYTLVIGCEVTSLGALPEGVVAKTVPAATYAVHDATGPQPATIIATWQRVYGAGLRRTYGGDFDRHHSEGRVDVYVAIR